MEEKKNVSGGGVGFLGLLALVFIVLKLTGLITWPWLWVLVPLWGPVALLLAIVVVALPIILIVQARKRHKEAEAAKAAAAFKRSIFSGR